LFCFVFGLRWGSGELFLPWLATEYLGLQAWVTGPYYRLFSSFVRIFLSISVGAGKKPLVSLCYRLEDWGPGYIVKSQSPFYFLLSYDGSPKLSLPIFSIKRNSCGSAVAHNCNPSYLEGWDLEGHGSRPAWANRSQDLPPISKITRTK
jgi:hypothetical protein